MTLDEWLRACPLPRSEARMLLQFAGGFSRAELVTRGNEALPGVAAEALAALVARRQAGEPVAYILGERGFYGRMFAVNPSVLIPRPETEHLVEAAMARLPQGGRVWDLGTGSGAVAVTLALERPDAAVRASDISEEALETAQGNAAKLGAAVEFALGSWFAVDRPSEKNSYDVIVSNPPYIEKDDAHLQQGDLRFEPQNALTDFSDGLTCIRALASGAPEYLKTGGWILLEHGYNQGNEVQKILINQEFENVETLPDLAGLDRVTFGQWLRA
ncbi:peptide chain release factor N(5)-glutamine methyltransferase [Neisseria chenwenguii]|uniref:Release factor glutamine methyltransferase n=1 Tax=Neisseria chenwenguii TaxID=1853278 RepID=A0A220S2M3_9NEIS|nr:peptide chain release factor N(5)-glutamine methyltransferase [Neisseria chenwenguii]ASK27692.1 protein-(glutamine-N5) methyltransferase, release factor-specific [Neisseria chenwenguii]ROV55690.1 peptide chain release factor N(5)-glutamine methyltransferase [Neisseria chenwenguii]